MIFLATLASLFVTTLNTMLGVDSIDESYFRAAGCLGAKRWQIFWHVVVPGAMPFMFTGLQISIGVAWFSLVAAEMVSGDGVTTYSYGKDGLLAEVVNEQADLEYKMDNLYRGKLFTERRTEYSARSGLSNLKFTYEYDSNMRVTKMAGRIGGKKVKPLEVVSWPSLKLKLRKWSKTTH